MAKMKNLFPKIKRGGYSVNVRFVDEGRGERYFDAEWSVHGEDVTGRFNLTYPVAYDSRLVHDNPSVNSVGRDFRVGDRVTITVYKWNMRGKHFLHARQIEVTGVNLNGETQFTEIDYVYPKT